MLVILDGSTKDLGTSYKILNDVIIPELGEETGRILVALNQADIAMKTGRHWDYENNEPDETLVQFLDEKVESIKARIKEDSNLDIEPIYYCAGYKEDGGEVVHPYNLSKERQEWFKDKIIADTYGEIVRIKMNNSQFSEAETYFFDNELRLVYLVDDENREHVECLNFDYTDGSWDCVLDYTLCPYEELPEDERMLKLISDVRKGELDFYLLLHKFGRKELDELLEWQTR